MTKEIFFLFIMIGAAFHSYLCAESAMTIKSDVQKQEKMSLLLGLIHPNQTVLSIADFLKIILSQQHLQKAGFKVTIRSFEKAPSKKAIKKIAQEGFPLIVLISSAGEGVIESRLYDAQYASMIKGKRFSVAHMDAQNQAEYLADKLWPLLTGQEGIFATRIVFCKEVMTEEKKIAKNICLTPPYAFPNENSYQLITKNLIEKGRVFAPRWNRDTENPLVLFSESTLSNVRLVSVNLQKQRSIVSNFEGLNILPSFSCDGKRVIYCLSRNGKSQLYLYEFDKESDQPILREITNNNGNNISPTLCENGDIVFCSDFQSKGPQICYYHAFTEQIEVLTSGGYCACPTFCEKNGKIAYSKYVDGILQIFIYDTKTRQHAQITTDKGNKEECTWSPCGNYLAFAVDYGSACRIAVLNLITNERSFITGEKERCMYPCWSPRYAAPLVVAA